MQNIEIKTKQLITQDEILEANKSNENGGIIEYVGSAKEKNTLTVWNERHDFIKAGIGKESILALNIMIKATQSCNLDINDFSVFTRDYFREIFGSDNVLSCCGVEHNDYYVHLLIYPLNIRQLNPSRWIDGRTEQLKENIIVSFKTRCANKFGLNMNAEKQISGHTQYLDEFPTVKITREEDEEVYYDSLMPDEYMQSDLPKDKIVDISNMLIEYFTTGVERAAYIKLCQNDISSQDYIDEAKTFLLKHYQNLSERDLDLIIARLVVATMGFYILEPLINDDNISDIKVVAPNKIRVKVNGKRRTSNLQFIDDKDYFRFLKGIGMRYNLDFDYSAFHVFTDKNTNPNFILRNNITTDAINSNYPVYHIRKVPKNKRSVQWLVEHDVMDETVANYLIWAARSAKGIVFTGKGSSGKTTMMNALLEYIPTNASGLVIQESEELYSNKPELTFQHITGEYDLQDLSRNGLLTDIDYFIIGEVKGGEAMYFINACDTGNKGWCSVHSPSSTEAIDKLADYVMYESKYDKEQAMHMLKELQVIVFMKNFKVAEISEVVGWDSVNKCLNYRTVYRNEAYL